MEGTAEEEEPQRAQSDSRRAPSEGGGSYQLSVISCQFVSCQSLISSTKLQINPNVRFSMTQTGPYTRLEFR